MRRKLRLIKKIFLILLCCLVILFLGNKIFGNDSFYHLKYSTVRSSNLPSQFDGFTIAYISDLNIYDKFDITRIETALSDLNEKDVDMVLFGGDIYDNTPFNQEGIIKILKAIPSKYGKFAVLGDKDQVESKTCESILTEAGFEVLHNEYRPIYYNNKTIALFGLEHNGDVSGLVSKKNQDFFKLVLVHEPDYFDATKQSKIDLQISGHTLGGYYKIPFYGGVIKKEMGNNYTNGRYEDANAKSELIVSNGLNKEANQKYRILTTDEINIITLKR